MHSNMRRTRRLDESPAGKKVFRRDQWCNGLTIRTGQFLGREEFNRLRQVLAITWCARQELNLRPAGSKCTVL
jgi:hypothetical protein